MKVKVIESFIDKHTNEVYDKDAVIEVTEKRFNEILERGKFVEPLKETKKGETKNGNETAHIS